jgi:hypothetical protein
MMSQHHPINVSHLTDCTYRLVNQSGSLGRDPSKNSLESAILNCGGVCNAGAGIMANIKELLFHYSFLEEKLCSDIGCYYQTTARVDE